MAPLRIPADALLTASSGIGAVLSLRPGGGAQSVLFCKTLSSLLRTSFTGDSQFGSWFLYLNLVLFILVAAFWVQRLNTVRPMT